MESNPSFSPRPSTQMLHQPLPLKTYLVALSNSHWPQRHRLGSLRGLEHWQPNRNIPPARCPRSRWPVPSLRRPQRRLLRRPHRQPPHRSPNPLRHHDVHLRLPRRNNHAQLQRLRRTQPRHLRRRPPSESPRTRPRQ